MLHANADFAMQVAELLSNKDVKLATTAASILIHAAAPMLQQIDSKDENGDEEQEQGNEEEGQGFAAKLKPLLLQLCSCGAPKAAKVAIRCGCYSFCCYLIAWLVNHVAG